MKYGFHAKLTTHPGKQQDLVDILLKAAKVVSATKGCHLYMVSTDESNENAVWITEAWASKEDHDNSLKLEEVRALIGQGMPLIAEPPQKGQELLIHGGAGVNQY